MQFERPGSAHFGINEGAPSDLDSYDEDDASAEALAKDDLVADFDVSSVEHYAALSSPCETYPIFTSYELASLSCSSKNQEQQNS
jgi:hypothetical protein